MESLYCKYSGKLARYHGGPVGQPHQPGEGPGFMLSDGDKGDPQFKYFGSDREEIVKVVV